MVTVEPGRIDDVDAVVDLWVDLAAGQRAFDSHLLAERNRTAVREAIARRAVEGGLLVARDPAGEVVGFVTFALRSSTYEADVTRGIVENIYVEPDRRGEGVGSALLGEAEARLAEEGATAVTLEVMADNEAARRFYRRHGYASHRVELEKSVESDTLTKE
jgi:ribosomal protein S18 acetylase RimI-like enzyme